MMPLRVAIVEDEALARERLRLMLNSEPDIEVTVECEDGEEAIAVLGKQPVDLVFLDVQMPECSGLEVARRLGPALPPTIFLTAFHQYAIDAFEVEAVDYLTKPVEPARLRQALDRVRKRHRERHGTAARDGITAVLALLEQHRPVRTSFPQRLLVPDGPKEILIPVQSIEWIEAADYYSKIHVDTRSYLLREPLGALEEKLDPKQFLRIHRSTLVNLSFVRELHREGLKEGMLTLLNGHGLRTSKAGRSRLESFRL